MIYEEFNDVINFICNQDVSQAIDQILRKPVIIDEIKLLEKTINTSKVDLDLDFPNLKKLIIFFTLIEQRQNRLRRMSASVVPKLLEKARLIEPGEYPNLVDWIYEHKHPDNIWLPFGESKYGQLRSYDDYLTFTDQEKARLLAHTRRQIQQEKDAIDRKKKRKQNHLLRQKLAKDMLNMDPLKTFITRLRKIYPEPKCFVPGFCPNDGGANAEIMFLLEKPGPMTAPRNGGSGYVSFDNNDPTARAARNFISQIGVERRKIIVWNAIPVWNGTRNVRSKERKIAWIHLQELLQVLPNLRSIVLVGNQAKKMKKYLDSRQYLIFESAHPSPIVKARFPEKWAEIPEHWNAAYTRIMT